MGERWGAGVPSEIRDMSLLIVFSNNKRFVSETLELNTLLCCVTS